METSPGCIVTLMCRGSVDHDHIALVAIAKQQRKYTIVIILLQLLISY